MTGTTRTGLFDIYEKFYCRIRDPSLSTKIVHLTGSLVQFVELCPPKADPNLYAKMVALRDKRCEVDYLLLDQNRVIEGITHKVYPSCFMNVFIIADISMHLKV